MDNEQPMTSRRGFLKWTGKALLGSAAGASIAGGVEATKDSIFDKKDRARTNIAERAAKASVAPEVIVTHIIATYDEELRDIATNTPEAKAQALKNAATKLETGEFHIKPEFTQTVIGKYEEKLVEIGQDSHHKTLSYAGLGAVAASIAHLVQEPPSPKAAAGATVSPASSQHTMGNAIS